METVFRLMGLLLAALFLLSISVWLSLSLQFFWAGNGESFQRLGTVAIVAAVLLFSSMRYFIDDLPADEPLRRFVIDSSHEDRVEDRTMDERARLAQEVLKIEVAITKIDKMKHLSNVLFRYEIALVVIGTLQTGYGDLVVDYFHGIEI